MSKCISHEGEYSEHVVPGEQEFTCSRCWVVDEDAMYNALTEARERIDTVISGVRAWCSINEIAEPPLDWEGLGEFLAYVTPPGERSES